MNYPYVTITEVRYRDIDSLNHVSNTAYYVYIQDAYLKFIMDLLQLTSYAEISQIMVSSSCVYKAPAFFGEKLEIGVGVSRIGTKSFELSYLLQKEDGSTVATGKTTHVMYDYGKNETCVVSNAFKEKVKNYQSDWSLPEIS